MEAVKIRLKVRKDKDASDVVEEEFIVDTGVPCALAPMRLLRKLGIKAMGQEHIFVGLETLARPTGEAYFELGDRGGYAKVMFGERGDVNLVAVDTLKALGLWLHPFTRQLEPLPATAA